MSDAEIALNVVIWTAILGCVAFCLLYAILASPWKDHMGRHVLSFMSGLAIALIYGAVSRFMEVHQRILGWIISISLIAALVWWRVVILVRYQIQERTQKK